MREILVDESAFDNADSVHAYLASELDFPSYYGSNLDALNDCLGDVSEQTTITLHLAADTSSFSPWFAKLVRTLLRAARENDCLDVLVHASSLQSLYNLAQCPGLLDLLDADEFMAQGIIACLHERGEGE